MAKIPPGVTKRGPFGHTRGQSHGTHGHLTAPLRLHSGSVSSGAETGTSGSTGRSFLSWGSEGSVNGLLLWIDSQIVRPRISDRGVILQTNLPDVKDQIVVLFRTNRLASPLPCLCPEGLSLHENNIVDTNPSREQLTRTGSYVWKAAACALSGSMCMLRHFQLSL